MRVFTFRYNERDIILLLDDRIHGGWGSRSRCAADKVAATKTRCWDERESWLFTKKLLNHCSRLITIIQLIYISLCTRARQYYIYWCAGDLCGAQLCVWNCEPRKNVNATHRPLSADFIRKIPTHRNGMSKMFNLINPVNIYSIYFICTCNIILLFYTHAQQ